MVGEAWLIPVSSEAALASLELKLKRTIETSYNLIPSKIPMLFYPIISPVADSLASLMFS